MQKTLSTYYTTYNLLTECIFTYHGYSQEKKMTQNVTMAELNKKANAIINQVAETGESVTVLKHGKPVAEIVSINENKVREDAIQYLLDNPPVRVTSSIDSVIEEGRNRGL